MTLTQRLRDGKGEDSELEGWKEATIAWTVCASIHRSYAEKRDPVFKKRQADFVKSENKCREAYLALLATKEPRP